MKTSHSAVLGAAIVGFVSGPAVAFAEQVEPRPTESKRVDANCSHPPMIKAPDHAHRHDTSCACAACSVIAGANGGMK